MYGDGVPMLTMTLEHTYDFVLPHRMRGEFKTRHYSIMAACRDHQDLIMILKGASFVLRWSLVNVTIQSLYRCR